MKTESYSHCHGESSFHILFNPKYRHDIFGKVEINTAPLRSVFFLKRYLLVRTTPPYHPVQTRKGITKAQDKFDMQYCSECRTEIGETDRFCKNCGKSLANDFYEDF